ncbi:MULTISPECIES: amidase [unclassified Pseudomonas]|uniref:amidase n=1 Tax=unclassified Pseudomonas TaxID=196821 RepID=UPI000C86E250|nr:MULTISPECIES: amidase [unclassified Pseudomonas]PMU13123.1 amidase [Pseudomonas sp. GP01-A9]PMU16870.1 amidase [Pseudomonas sp. GP01-A13]PMU30885.1 amidase [Pseudomonas sp. GP01-A8]PMU41583.1 amidase [Pseudomonas sp. GP01-A14]PMU48148.1 amidase [Pseudomonas sp. GP01-A6]
MSIVELDAIELSRAIHARQVSCHEVMQAYLAQVERFNPTVNALVSLRSHEDVLAEAAQRDRELDQGQSRGWMHGMPQAIKDLAATRGLRTTLGSPLFAEHVPQEDAISVARVRASGAIIIGKTNVPEFGLGSQTYNSVFGTTGNAYDPRLVAGGSSGGAAVALALRMLPVADGSDMMGSLRNPGAFNNVFGLRPSQGRVPHGPAPELFVQQLATEGPMGRSVADVARLLSVQAGYDPRVPLSLKEDPAVLGEPLQRDFKGARLGWLGDYNGYLPMEDGVMSLCESALKDFAALGCEVEHCQPEFSLERLWQTWLVHRHWLIQGSLGAAYADPQKRALLKPEAQWEVQGGLQLSAADVYQASINRSDWYRALGKLFERYDFLLLPTAQVFPFDAQQAWPRLVAGREMDTYHRWMEVVIGPTLAGLPSMNVPVGFNPQGLPMGLQIIGPAQADRAVLQLAYAHEQLTRWVQRRPPACLSATG